MDKRQEHILFKTTTIIKMITESGKTLSSGTGFFCENKDKQVFLITNNHVIKRSSHIKLRLTLTDIALGYIEHKNIIIDLGKDIHQHTEYDLCAIPFSNIIEELKLQGKKLNIVAVPYSGITQDFSIFKHIEKVVMVGYPNSLINNDINYPIIRNGHTATGLCDTYEGKQEFLINIPVYGGSSGSPIYYIDKNEKVKLVGINYANHNEKKYIYQNRLYHKKIIGSIYIPNGIGYVIKSNILIELIN